MTNWLTQAHEWVSTALPIWGEVLEYITEYSFLDLIKDVFLDPLHPIVGVLTPTLGQVLQSIVNTLENTIVDTPVISWLLMSSATVVFIYLSVSFVKWIIGIIT